MSRRRRPGTSRRLLPLLVGLLLGTTSLSAAGPAEARGNGGSGSSTGCNPVGDQTTCVSGVYFTTNGSSTVTTQTATGGSSDWSPPACWYEPTGISPKLLETAFLFPLADIVILALTNGDSGTNGDFHDGQKGRWWEFVYNPSMPLADAQAQCQLSGAILEWVADATPPPQEAVTVWKMAAAARNEIPVVPPTLALRPGADNQVVNLATLVSLANPYSRTFVTAHLNVNGYVLAATTIATPASITVNAGTSGASPSSCTYALTPVGGGNSSFQVDPASTHCSDGSTGSSAGIIYRRPTAAGTTYPLTATVTWNVTWTDTDSPDSPPQTGRTLPPLTMTTPPTPVTVNEVETVN